MYLLNSLCLKKSLNSSCILLVNTLLLSPALLVLSLKLSGMFALLSCASTLSVLFYKALFVLQLGLLDANIVCKLNFLLSCGSPITSHVIFSMFSSSLSAIHSRAGPYPGTTKNLHLLFFSLCLNLIVHM